MHTHKKPAGYQAHIPFAVALHGVHRHACREVKRLHGVNWVEMEYLLGTQYTLQLAARDMIGVSQIGKTSGRGSTPTKNRKMMRYLDQLLNKGCLQKKELGKKGTLYGLTHLGAEVIRYYQRQLFKFLGLMEQQEKLHVSYKYFTLTELPGTALDKGHGR